MTMQTTSSARTAESVSSPRVPLKAKTLIFLAAIGLIYPPSLLWVISFGIFLLLLVGAAKVTYEFVEFFSGGFG